MAGPLTSILSPRGRGARTNSCSTIAVRGSNVTRTGVSTEVGRSGSHTRRAVPGYAARVTAIRGPAAFLSTSLILSPGGAERARAEVDDERDVELDDKVASAPTESVAPFEDARFGPRYVIDEVIVLGNRKTAKSMILAELGAIGLWQWVEVDASD